MNSAMVISRLPKRLFTLLCWLNSQSAKAVRLCTWFSTGSARSNPANSLAQILQGSMKGNDLK